MNRKTTPADKAYNTLTDAGYCAKLLEELLTLAQESAEPSCELSDCALGGLAAINRHIFNAVLDGRNLYCELTDDAPEVSHG